MESAIRFLTAPLVERGDLPAGSLDQIIGDLLKRERLGSTAIGDSIALPHCASSALNRVAGVLARCPKPIRWGSAEPQSVKAICLMLAPAEKSGDHTRVLEQVAKAIGPYQGER
jgi:nitrogen PTS system EIIA component